MIGKINKSFEGNVIHHSAKQMENLVHRFSAPQSLEPENESKDEG
jgi:hypothetical protein